MAERLEPLDTPLVVAVYQGAAVPADIAANTAIIRREAACAAARGAHLVSFPEVRLVPKRD